MVAKRALDFGGVTPAKNAKKIKKLQQIVSTRTPERKYQVFQFASAIGSPNVAVIDVTAIAQGTNYNERVGNHIRIKSVSISGYLGGDKVDVFLIQAKNAGLLTTSNFGATVGAELTYSDGRDNFIEWYHYLPLGGGSNVNYKRRFQYGIKTEYTGSGSTTCSLNRLMVVISNRSGATVTPSVFMKVEYIDS